MLRAVLVFERVYVPDIYVHHGTMLLSVHTYHIYTQILAPPYSISLVPGIIRTRYGVYSCAVSSLIAQTPAAVDPHNNHGTSFHWCQVSCVRYVHSVPPPSTAHTPVAVDPLPEHGPDYRLAGRPDDQGLLQLRLLTRQRKTQQSRTKTN